MEEERELEREIKEMAIRKREIQREMERRIMERRIMERKRFIGITEKSLPYSVDCPPENKKLKIKLNKKTDRLNNKTNKLKYLKRALKK